MEDKPFSRRRLLAAAGTALSAAIAGCSLGAPEQQLPDAGNSSSPNGFPDEFDAPSENLSRPAGEAEFTQVYQELVDSVAAIRVETEEATSGGTGWVYENDYLVTNAHVVRGTDEPFVWFTDIGWREATVVGTDIHSDLAVVEVESRPEGATPLSLVEQPRAVGTPVAAIGNPFGRIGSFTTGVISGRNRTIQIPSTNFSIADGIQTDTALNPGNSGGPLVTLDGEVLGVINAGRGDNVGFAISTAMVRNVVPSLIETGNYDHAYMGVQLGNVTPRIIEANDLPVSWGVYIARILPDGPSDGVLQGRSGTEVVRGQETSVGGDVVVRMDDWEIPNRERLSAYLALETTPGDTIEVEVVRDGERRVVDLTVGSRPEDVA